MALDLWNYDQNTPYNSPGIAGHDDSLFPQTTNVGRGNVTSGKIIRPTPTPLRALPSIQREVVLQS